LQITLNDQRQMWDMRPDGSYVQRQPERDGAASSIGTHQVLMELARQRAK
jgi:polyphosphate kinase